MWSLIETIKSLWPYSRNKEPVPERPVIQPKIYEILIYEDLVPETLAHSLIPDEYLDSAILKFRRKQRSYELEFSFRRNLATLIQNRAEGMQADLDKFLEAEEILRARFEGTFEEEAYVGLRGLCRVIKEVPTPTQKSLVGLGIECREEGLFNFRLNVQFKNVPPQIYNNSGLPNYKSRHLTAIRQNEPDPSQP